jgi:hypothetical protein
MDGVMNWGVATILNPGTIHAVKGGSISLILNSDSHNLTGRGESFRIRKKERPW